MKSDIYHLAGVCISSLKIFQPLLTLLIGLLLGIIVIRVIFILLKTFFYQRNFAIADTPDNINRLAKKIGLINKLKIVSDPKPLAFCLGIMSEKIYISTGLIKTMKKNELQAILLHEKYHLINHDNLSIIFLKFIKHFFVFFPFIAELTNNLIIKKEVKADNYSISLLGETKSIISAFKKLLANRIASPVLQYLPAFAGSNEIEIRIKILLGKKYKTNFFKTKSFIINIFALILFGSVILFPWQKTQAIQTEKKPAVCLKGLSCSDNC